MNNLADAIEHILWTLPRSPQAYRLFRERCLDLHAILLYAELKWKLEENKNANSES